MITQIDDYFSSGCGRCPRFATAECSTQRWQQGLLHLRQMCLGVGLLETVKWGHPCYMHAGRNVVVFGAFLHDFRISFFEAGLLRDPSQILEKQGPNSPIPGTIRFTENHQVTDKEPIIVSYLREAMEYADQGIRAPRVQVELDMPDELNEALAADPELAEAFGRLTPGRQKSYRINLHGAKKSETRWARIAKFRDKILAGKGALER